MKKTILGILTILLFTGCTFKLNVDDIKEAKSFGEYFSFLSSGKTIAGIKVGNNRLTCTSKQEIKTKTITSQTIFTFGENGRLNGGFIVIEFSFTDKNKTNEEMENEEAEVEELFCSDEKNCIVTRKGKKITVESAYDSVELISIYGKKTKDEIKEMFKDTSDTTCK